MRVVVDTNVLVSAVINPRGTPARLVDEIRALKLIPMVSGAVLDEYGEVLRRPHFRFQPGMVDELLDDIVALALHIQPDTVRLAGLPDPDDAPFIATALRAGCPIITGNLRHFPEDCGVEILSPAECLQRLFKT